MFLSFDVDAETAWTAHDPKRYRQLVTDYEGRDGVPRLRDLLLEQELKATFFITGWSRFIQR